MSSFFRLLSRDVQFELARRVLPEINPVDDVVMRRCARALNILDTQRQNARISPTDAGELCGDGGRLIVSALMRGSIHGAVHAL